MRERAPVGWLAAAMSLAVSCASGRGAREATPNPGRQAAAAEATSRSSGTEAAAPAAEQARRVESAGAADAGREAASGEAEERIRRRRAAESTLDRGQADWDQAVAQGRNTRATLCSALRKLRFPREGGKAPLELAVPVEGEDGGRQPDLIVTIAPDGTVESCR